MLGNIGLWWQIAVSKHLIPLGNKSARSESLCDGLSHFFYYLPSFLIAGICAMCGKKIASTKAYKQSSTWERQLLIYYKISLHGMFKLECCDASIMTS